MDPEADAIPLDDLASLSQIAEAVGMSVRRVAYSARGRGVAPAYQFGNLPVYGRAGQLAILEDLTLPRLSSGPRLGDTPECRTLRNALRALLAAEAAREEAEHAALVAAGLRRD